MTFLSQVRTKAAFSLALYLVQAATTQGFVAPVQLSQKPFALFGTATDKPTPQEIERAAGQLVKDGENLPEQAAIQGLRSKIQQECGKYSESIEQNLKLKEKLLKLVAPRPYPLFLMEKAAKYLVDDVFNPDSRSHAAPINGAKEKLVILGAGWGSAAFLRNIDNDKYDVTVISPRNFFVFTPMLAGASVGTVDVRSITQPIRQFNLKANYLEAAAYAIDPKTRKVKCNGVVCKEFCDLEEFEVPYDRLIVAVGAKVNTFGIPGVEENCLFLKQIEDAVAIRRKIVNLFERANIPGTPEKQLREFLTFAIIGAGPSGVEFAAELRDFIEEDGPKYYPHLLKYVSIKVIEATPVILRPFDEALQKAAVVALTHKTARDKASLLPEQMLELIVNKPVKEVAESEITLQDGTNIPYGLAIWAGGIGPLPITSEIIHALGGRQEKGQSVARGKIAVDPWLRAIEGDGRVFALGDCTCSQSGCLPSTAQVAAQQGEYLAHLLSVGDLANLEYEEDVLLPPRPMKGKTKLTDAVASMAIGSNEFMAPFQFLDMGILAYTGSYSALAQVQLTPDAKTRVKASGRIGFGMWRSVYLLKQSSFRNRVSVVFDWIKARMFGRDITSFG